MILLASSIWPAAAATAAFLAGHGILWTVQPEGAWWFAGSIALTLIWGAVFLKLITREKAK